MAAEHRQNFAGLMKDLLQNGPAYSVFYAIYLCETLLKDMHPEWSREKLEQTGLRFRPYEHFGYPPRNIRKIEVSGEEVQFVINFLGLYGVNSPLPRCYHEQVSIQQNIHGPGEVPLQNFLDIFNNRFYWLYYQAWKKYRYYLKLSEGMADETVQRIFAFIGHGPLFAKNHSAGEKSPAADISPYKLLQLSGVLSHRVRHKSGLLIMLREFFPNLPIKLQEFVPTMVRVAERPGMGNAGDRQMRLGLNGLVGQSVIDYMSRICLHIGPLDFEEYLRFMPGGKYAALLQRLLNFYLNDGLECDLKFIIKAESITPHSLSDRRQKVGQSFWLGKPKRALVETYLPHEKYAV